MYLGLEAGSAYDYIAISATVSLYTGESTVANLDEERESCVRAGTSIPERSVILKTFLIPNCSNSFRV